MTLEYESTGPDNADYLVVWMHGLGADGFDFLPIVKSLGLSPSASIRFIFPHAPSMAVTVNQGMVMRAWYDIKSVDFRDRADVDGVKKSVNTIKELIAEVSGAMNSSPKIILAGFSQGGVIALATALSSDTPIAAVLALSTYLPEELRVMPNNCQIEGPIFMAHGVQDPVIPMSVAEESYAWLESKLDRTSWVNYAMPHAVCPDEIDDIGQFIHNVISQ